jgi:hypothetical protein
MRYTFALAGLTIVLVLLSALLLSPRTVEPVAAPTSRLLEAAERQQHAGMHVEDYQFTAEDLRPDGVISTEVVATRPTTSPAVHQ